MLSKLLNRKIIFVALGLLLFLFLSVKPIQAFSTPNESYQLNFEKAVYETGEMNLQSFVYETLKATAGSVVTTTIGCFSCPADQRNFGMAGSLTVIITMFYSNMPASGVSYLADIGERLNIVQPTYAQQGIGYQKLNAYKGLWTAFRNLSYIFFVLIFIITGFAIMFRIKLSPQVVVGVQSALPRIVVGLILVTFSYAIVGFLIDLMFVVTNLIMFTFKHSVSGIPAIIQGRLSADPITDEWRLIVEMIKIGVPAIILPLFVMIAVPGAFALTGNPVGIGVSVILLVIFAVVFIIALLRVLWMLLKAYVFVVLNLIFAPFIILVGTIPGVNTIGGWFRGIIANLAIFPLVFIMTFIAGYLALSSLPFTGIWTDAFNTYYKGGDWLVLIQAVGSTAGSTIQPALMLLFISPVILLMTPKAGDIIQSFITGKPFAYGTAIGEAVGTAKIAGQIGAPYIAPRLGATATAGGWRNDVYKFGQNRRWWA